MLPFCRPSNLRPVSAFTLVAGTSVESDYGVSALNDGDPSLPLWIQDTSIGLQGDLGSAVRIDGVALIHHNFAAGTDLRLRVHSAASWGGAVDITVSATVPEWLGRFAPHIYFDVATAAPAVLSRTRRYFYIDNQDANNAAIQIGEVVVVGVVEELAVGLLSGAQMSEGFGRSLNSSRAGVATVHDYRTRSRSWTGGTLLDDTDKPLFEALQRDSYGVRPFVFWPLGLVSDEPAFGRFVDASYVPTVPHVEVASSADLVLEELSCGEAY